MTREVRVSAGDLDDLRHHVVWCPKYRRQFLVGRVAARREGLIRANVDEDGWLIVAPENMPDRVHLFVNAHPPPDCPFRIAGQSNSFTLLLLRAEFPYLPSRLPTLWPGSCLAAGAGAVSAETVCRCKGTQNGRSWRKERAR